MTGNEETEKSSDNSAYRTHNHFAYYNWNEGCGSRK